MGSTWYFDGTTHKSGGAGYAPLTPTDGYAGAEVAIWTAQATPGAEYDIRFRRKVDALPPCGPDWLLIGPEEDNTITADAGGNITPIGGSIPDDTPLGAAAIAFMNKLTGTCLPHTDIDVKQKQACVTDGGLFRDFDKKSLAAIAARKGCERHHMPSKASQIHRYNHRCSPTILMTHVDHVATASWGSSLSSHSFQANERLRIDAGTYAGYVEAFEMNATTVLATFPGPGGPGTGGKYDLSVQKARAKLTGSTGWDNWRACIQGVPPTENARELAGLSVEGTTVRVYATGAFQNLAYTLVLGESGTPGHASHACMETVVVLNPTPRFANSSGFISTTVGTIHYDIPGTYQLCFKDESPQNSTGTAGASFTIL